jgi:N-acetylmuramoyl-L-alanine amidase
MTDILRIVFLFFCGAIAVAPLPAQVSNGAYRIRTVVIDAGHGGRDPGVVGRRLKEKDVVLPIALKLGKLIKEQHPDVQIIYTRDKDVSVELTERSAIANRSNADLFISIHANSQPNKNRSAGGSETYIMGLHRSEESLEVARRENAVIAYEEDYDSKYEGFDPNSPESYIIFSLMQNAYLERSLAFAGMVQEQMPLSPIKKSRGVKQAGYLVLWRTTMPSVLIEVAFLSNPTEEALLAKEETRNDIAGRIATAFTNYKKKYEQQAPPTVPTVAQTTPEPPAPTPPPAETAPQPKETPAVAEEVKKPATTATTTKPATTATAQTKKTSTAATPKKPAIQYGVQIFATSTRKNLNEPAYQSLKDIRCFPDGKFFKYVVGTHRTYDEALLACLKLRATYSDAFVVRIQNNKILPLNR